MVSAFAALHHELDRWAAAGRCATLWWRDDDAATATPALATLLALRARHGVPLCLAVVPEAADGELARLLAAQPAISVAQHGWAHRNHAPPSAKKSEFPATRPAPAALDDLARGRRRLTDLFGPVPAVLVPPWNRIAPGLLAQLGERGWRGLSTFGPRSAAGGTGGSQPVQVNCHVDPVDWHGSRGFLGSVATLERLVGHLAARRTGRVDGAEATGLLTHHLVLDAPGLAFVDALLAETIAHPAARWQSAETLFGTAA